jgi:replicative DNA helicase
MLSAEGQVSMRSLRQGKLSAAELDRLQEAKTRISALPITIDENYTESVDQIISRCRAIKADRQTSNLRLVIIDYLQLLSGEATRKDMTREREVASMSRRLKLMALELGVSVIALSQLNDDGQLRESRAIGHDADIILNLEQPEDEHETIEFNLAKIRQGAKKRLRGYFKGEYMIFWADPVTSTAK